ncbi:hypothetical protein [Streptomyces sp. NPDC002990]
MGERPVQTRSHGIEHIPTARDPITPATPVHHAVIRAAVVATLTNIGAPLCGSGSGPGGTCGLDFGPAVSSDAVFGTPYPIFNGDWRWNAADPTAHMDQLAGMGIALYTGNGNGNGNGNPADGEFWVNRRRGTRRSAWTPWDSRTTT